MGRMNGVIHLHYSLASNRKSSQLPVCLQISKTRKMDCKINLEEPRSHKAKGSDLGLVGKNLRRKFVVDQRTWKRLIGHYEHERSEGNIITIDENVRNENYIFLWNIPMLFNVMLVVLLFVAEYPLQFTYWESIQTVILTAVFATIFLVAIFPRNYLTSSWIDERLGCKGLRFSSLQLWLIIIMNQIGLPKVEQPPCTRT